VLVQSEAEACPASPNKPKIFSEKIDTFLKNETNVSRKRGFFFLSRTKKLITFASALFRAIDWGLFFF